MMSLSYKIYLLDGEGRVTLARGVDCADDLAALEEAEYHCVENPVEVWQDARLVARVKARNQPLSAADPTSL